MTRSFPALATAVDERIAVVVQQRMEAQARDDARAELLELGVIGTLTGWVLLGGHGYDPDLTPGTSCDLFFTREGLRVTDTGGASLRIRVPYDDSRAIEFSGPGTVRTGGGAVGFGHGLLSIAEGMAAAALLNKLTTHYSIQTIIRYQARDFEFFFFFFCSTATPSELRIQLSEVVSLVEAAAAAASTSPAAPTDLATFTTQLVRLGEMFTAGLLTPEEFAAAKARLLG